MRSATVRRLGVGPAGDGDVDNDGPAVCAEVDGAEDADAGAELAGAGVGDVGPHAASRAAIATDVIRRLRIPISLLEFADRVAHWLLRLAEAIRLHPSASRS
jgi:hypothetical protein